MIDMRQVRFDYPKGVFGLRVDSLTIDRGDKAAVIGPSGAGKTTLISLISGIIAPRQGTITLGGTELTTLGEGQRRALRITRIGFVFQEFELIDYLPVRENILLPYFLNGAIKRTAKVDQYAEELAAAMKLGGMLKRYPKTLSHGEKQRVAICRALVTSPELIIADEPTGNLDPPTAATILDILRREVDERGATLLMVTHNHALLDAFDRVIRIEDFNVRARP